MKALVANKFFFRNGGSEAVMFQERDFLLRSGFDVIDFSMQDPRNVYSDYSGHFVSNRSYETGAGGTLARIGAALKLMHSPEAVRKIGQLIDETQPDIVHCHNIYHQLTPSIIGAAKGRQVPVVLTLHDYKPICPTYTRLRDGHVCSACIENQFSNVMKYRCADGSLGKSALLYAEATVQRLFRSYEKVDMFIAPSEFMRSSVTQHRLDEDRVEVIYNGIDCAAIDVAAEDQGYALYLGRLSPEKGIETLLSAHAEIADRVPLVIAGTGPLEQTMRSRYPKAQYLGHLSGDALKETVRNAAMIVVPSEWYENCPMSVLEAMASGKPVVASNIGGIPELVTPGETGLLFRPGDHDMLKSHLLQLISYPELRRVYGDAARKRAEHSFSLEQHNDALMHLYRNVIDRASIQTSTGISPHFAPPQE